MRLRRLFIPFLITTLLATATTVEYASAEPSAPGENLPDEGDHGNGPTGSTDSSDAVFDNTVIGTIASKGSKLVSTSANGISVTLSSAVAATSERHTFDVQESSVLQGLLDSQGTASMARVDNAAGQADFLVSTDDKGFSVLLEITAATSITEYEFKVDTPEGTNLVLTEDGSIDVLGENGFTVGSFEPPWAIDAAGHDVATQYRLNGNTITQIVNTTNTTLYPVVADPRFTWGLITGTVYFDKWETIAICSSGRAAIESAITLSIAAGFAAPAWAAVVFLIVASVTAVACKARLSDKCVKLKSTGSFKTYSGGYCTWYHS